MLNAVVDREKAKRIRFSVLNREARSYQLYSPSWSKQAIRLNLDFYALDKWPECGDGLYFSENLFGGLKDGLRTFQFSTEIGWPSARKPHDFLLDPKEFLILEYADGTTILLEEQYG